MSMLRGLSEDLKGRWDAARQDVRGENTGIGLERMGRWAAGSAMATANLAAQAAHVGARTGAQVFESLAAPLNGLPGVGMARQMAEVIDQRASNGARAAGERLSQSLDWMTASSVRSDDEADEPRAAAPAWSELAADAALAPISSLVESSLAVGVASLRAAASTRPGQLALDATLARLGVAPEDGSMRFQIDETRRSLVALSTDSGASALQAMFDLAEASARLALRDARPLHQVINQGLDEMRNLVESADMQEMLPTPMVSEELKDRARQVVENAPERLLRELEESGNRPRLAPIFRASLEDADNLRVFVTVYPQVVTLIGTDVGKLLFAGSITFSEMEAFMEGRRAADPHPR